MNIAVVYKSRYGAAKRYAQWIAEDLKCPIYNLSEVKPGQLDNCGAVVYGGGVYAGSVSGLKDAFSLFNKDLVVFAVGMAKPTEASAAAFKDKLIPAEVKDRTALFQLRGGYDLGKMSFFHKLVMMLVRGVMKKGESSPGEREKFKNKIVDFIDRSSLKPLVDYIKKTYK
ncbi:MAG: flavodoxin domain-containing protein [Clostridiales bacterium]|jgi:menaquinone-dependent protoporphyrinogen IX oxidase|nr:flavodoxin domain-containing protein [Clostridiales bacterium]